MLHNGSKSIDTKFLKIIEKDLLQRNKYFAQYTLLCKSFSSGMSLKHNRTEAQHLPQSGKTVKLKFRSTRAYAQPDPNLRRTLLVKPRTVLNADEEIPDKTAQVRRPI